VPATNRATCGIFEQAAQAKDDDADADVLLEVGLGPLDAKASPVVIEKEGWARCKNKVRARS